MSNDFTTVDWIKDTQRERDRLKHLRKLQGYAYYKSKGLDAILDNLLIVAVAMLIAMVNTVIIKLEHWLVAVKNCTGDDCLQLQWLIYIALGTLYAFISANIVYYVSNLAAGSGIPQVKTILGGFIIKKFLGFRTLVAKLLGLALSDASSLCLGKEGPLVHLACCVANICCRFVPKYSGNAAKRREIFSAACAAGVAVAFGSPIGGVLFSLEEVSYYFPFNTMAKSFYMATLASLTIHLLNPYGTNKLVMFQVDIPRNWELFELPIFCLLGVIGGIYGSIFIKFNIKLQKWRKNTPLIATHPIVEVVLLAFLSALLSYPVLYSRVSLAELVTNLFRDCDAVDPAFSEMCLGASLRVAMGLLYTIFLVSLLTTVTFGINVPAGLFVPTMAVGASTGRLLGLIFQTVIYNNPFILPGCDTEKNCITPGHFAIVGAAAFLGGVTRMTLSLVVIMFELTGAVSYILPIMITVVIAKWVAEKIERQGIYDALITFNKFPFLPTECNIKQGYIEDIMTLSGDLVVLHVDCIVADIQYAANQFLKGFPVLTKNEELVGYVLNSNLQNYLEKNDCFADRSVTFQPNKESYDSLDLSHLVDTRPVTVHPQMPLDVSVELFRKMGLRVCIVTYNGIIKGIVTKKDLLSLFI